MPRRERARLLLRGLAKLLGVVIAAGAVGIALGIGLSALTSDDDTAAPAEAPSTPTSTGTAAAQPDTAGAPAQSTTSSTSEPATATAVAPLAKVRVRVLGAVLHAARTPSGIKRQRARVAVRVRAENTGTTAATIARPAIHAAGETVKTDPPADSPQTNFGTLGAGVTRAVTLRFETAGQVTAQLTNQKTGRLRIAGRTIDLHITVGSPLSSSG